MNFAEFFGTIGSVIIVGFFINLITQKSRAERNIEKIERELKELSEEVSSINDATDSTVQATEQWSNEISREFADFEKIAHKITATCDNILLLNDGMLEKLIIICEAFDNPDMSDQEKKILVQNYTKRLVEDVKNNRQELLILQNQARGKGYAR